MTTAECSPQQQAPCLPTSPHRLETLSLASNNLTGVLDAAPWQQLPALVHVNLTANRFNGSLPGAWGALRGPNLTLDVSNNNLTGLLPASWGAPRADNTTLQLALLHASHNALTGATAHQRRVMPCTPTSQQAIPREGDLC